MKQKQFLYSLISVCLLLGWTSCSVEDKSVFGDDFEIPELTDENTIQFTANPDDWKEIGFIACGGRIAIEWGDGRLQKIANPSEDEPIVYKYGNLKTYQVRIWAEEIDYCRIEREANQIRNLRLGYLPNMKEVTFSGILNTARIDLSASCPNAEVVTIDGCPDLEEVDISGCRKLKHIQIFTLPVLRSLQLEGHPELEGIWCTEIDKLQSLSLKGLPKLNYLFCPDNPQLSQLEFDDEAAVSSLRIYNCAFQSADFLSKLPFLKELSCSSNQLTRLDLSSQSLLYTLSCSDNPRLTDLLIPEDNNLQVIECHYCNLDANALNAVFSRLTKIPAEDPKYEKLFYISYYKNRGEKDCNKDLLKGWHIVKNPAKE